MLLHQFKQRKHSTTDVGRRPIAYLSCEEGRHKTKAAAVEGSQDPDQTDESPHRVAVEQRGQNTCRACVVHENLARGPCKADVWGYSMPQENNLPPPSPPPPPAMQGWLYVTIVSHKRTMPPSTRTSCIQYRLPLTREAKRTDE